MTPRDDGGPAFPRPFSKDGETEAWSQDGMSLRDYFAGQSLMGLLSQWDTSPFPPKNVASHAYEFADAMLEARKR